MPRIFEARQQHISSIRDALVIKFIGLDNSEEHSGDAGFRKRLLETIREFYPTDLRKLPYGVDGAFFSSIEAVRIQAARTAIANQNWEFLIGMKGWECPAAEEIRRYIKTIKDLANEFGLRPNYPDDQWWAYDWLHDAVAAAMRLSRPDDVDALEKTWWAGKSWGAFVPTLSFTPSSWGREPWSDKNAIRARMLREFEDHWKEGDRRLAEAGFLIFKEREMVKHIHWLFLAIRPDIRLERPLNYQEIADRETPNEEGMDTSTVTKAVLRLARLLDVDLGKRPGRRNKL